MDSQQLITFHGGPPVHRELGWAEVTEGRVKPLAVAKDFDVVKIDLRKLPNREHLRAWLAKGWPAAFAAKYLRLSVLHPELADMTPAARALRDWYRGIKSCHAISQHIPSYGAWIELWLLTKEDLELVGQNPLLLPGLYKASGALRREFVLG